ncbi:MAG: hypothetical protein KGJ07_09395, partial [Patescibacteria group bacterium]|nr:hypothetical protein [Patescibacteria group bacterium]
MGKPEWYADVLGSIIHGSATSWGIANGIDKLDEGLALPETDMSATAVKARLARNILDIAVDIQKREGFEGLTRGWPVKDSFLEQFFGSYGGAAYELREMLKQSDIMHSVIVNF